VNGTWGGLIYLVAAGGLGYLLVTGNLAKLTAYATRGIGGTPEAGVPLQAEHPIKLLAFRGTAPGGIRLRTRGGGTW